MTTSTSTPAQDATPVSDAAWKCLKAPTICRFTSGLMVIARRIDDIDCAKEFLVRGLRGFVLKSHYIQTGERAQVVTKASCRESKRSVRSPLNHSVGGLNPVAVELAGPLGLQDRVMPDCRRAERNRRPARRRKR